MNSIRRNRFKRVAEARTNKIIDMINLLGNCSNKANYEYDISEVDEMLVAIENEIAKVRLRFHSEDGSQNRFTFRNFNLEKDEDITQISSSNTVKTPRYNAAFKLNYCDGGRSDTRIGFCGVCSPETIRYNIEVKHRSWCSREDCVCKNFYDGNCTYYDVQNEYNNYAFPCYDSATLRDWISHAGCDANGNPRKIRGARSQHLGIFTTVLPNEKEINRIIFGVFIMKKIFVGDDENYGKIFPDNEYCLELRPTEARNMRYWDYCQNVNHPETCLWGTGLIRYFDDNTAKKILRALVDIKQNEKGKDKAKKILTHYCKVNNIQNNE